MDELRELIRLQTWLSPAFPTGAFAYSHGLEAAIDCGLVCDGEELQNWLGDLVSCGAGWNDAVLLAETWRLVSRNDPIEDLVDLAVALCFSRERLLETTEQGAAFLTAAQAWEGRNSFPDDLKQKCPLPVAVGFVGAIHGTRLEKLLTAYLHAYVSNQIQAALRLMKLGQQGGVSVLARMESEILEFATNAANSTLDDLGNACMMAELMPMRHEIMPGRIFKS